MRLLLRISCQLHDISIFIKTDFKVLGWQTVELLYLDEVRDQRRARAKMGRKLRFP